MIDVIRWHVKNHEAIFSCWRFCTEYSLLQLEMVFSSAAGQLPTSREFELWGNAILLIINNIAFCFAKFLLCFRSKSSMIKGADQEEQHLYMTKKRLIYSQACNRSEITRTVSSTIWAARSIVKQRLQTAYGLRYVPHYQISNSVAEKASRNLQQAIETRGMSLSRGLFFASRIPRKPSVIVVDAEII